MATLKPNGKPGHMEIEWSVLEKTLAKIIVGGLLAIIGGGFLMWRDVAVTQTELRLHINDSNVHNDQSNNRGH